MNVSTSWKENVAPDEGPRFDRYANELRAVQKKRAAGGSVDRGLHAKSHLGVTGELTIEKGLPDALRVAVFSEPRSWPVYVRFSNGSGARQHDGAGDVRGMAVKLVGVPGKKLIPGLEDKRTQDFLFIHSPAVPFRSPDEFVNVVLAVAGGPALALPRLLGKLGVGRTFALLSKLKLPKWSSMAAQPFYTALPLRFGSTAAKLAVIPDGHAPSTGKLRSADGLRDDLAERLKQGPLSWSLRVQLFVDEATTPIEDPSVEWPEAKSPFHELGKLVIPKQDVSSPRGKKLDAYVDSLSFDPWHAVEELRPLGAMMRARAAAYRESVIERKAAPEPDQMVDFG